MSLPATLLGAAWSDAAVLAAVQVLRSAADVAHRWVARTHRSTGRVRTLTHVGEYRSLRLAGVLQSRSESELLEGCAGQKLGKIGGENS